MRALTAVVAALALALAFTASRAVSAGAPGQSSGSPVGGGGAAMFDAANVAPAGFIALFNGTDLTGWQGLIDGGPAKVGALPDVERAGRQLTADHRMRDHWSVRDGVLHFDGGGDSLQTVAPFKDFELYADWRIEKGGDSGIYLRGTPQVQIWDNEGAGGSGGLFNNEKNASRPLAVADRPVGEWNRFHILMAGDRVTVWLNGVLVTDHVPLENYWDRAAPLPAAGPIELQSHGQRLQFRNIFVREITPSEPTDRDRRMAWWRDARFGMFIHWGLYAIPAGDWKGQTYGGTAEWLMYGMKILPTEYEPLAGRFNPVKFDAGAWAALAADAGVKYVVITTKHHDGFALFDTARETYDVMDASPFKRDIMKELSEAVRARGLKMCWYHSILDWHHPDYLPRRAWDPRPAADADWSRFVEFVRAQVTEILTKYGPIGVMWFDGEWEDTWTEAEGKRLYELCRKLQPDVIVNNRVGKGRDGMAGLSNDPGAAGDFGTPEQEVPATGVPGVDWESCMTMNESWGFKRGDENWKSTRTLIRMLCEIASKGGNFLLNVGPTAEGLIPEPSVERLRAMGAWLKVNGEAIYGTHAGPFERLRWGRATARAGRLYLHVFEWPADGTLRLPGMLNEVRGARLLAAPGATLTPSADGVGVTITGLPAAAPDENATVIALDIVGEPAVVPSVLTQAADGTITLDALDAVIKGSTAKYESRDDRRCIGFWTDAADTANWDVRVHRPGRFRVSVDLACASGEAGSRYRVSVGRSFVEDTVPATAGWGDFVTRDLGEIEVGAPGRVRLTVAPQSKAHDAVMNLRRVRLVPVLPR